MTANQYAKLCRMGEVERVERLGGPGRCRLLFPPVRVFEGGGTPREATLSEYIKWVKRVRRHLGGRLPGNWRTTRGIKKRKKWLHAWFSVG